MNKVYYLIQCDTCQRIIRILKLKERGFGFQDDNLSKIAPAFSFFSSLHSVVHAGVGYG